MGRIFSESDFVPMSEMAPTSQVPSQTPTRRVFSEADFAGEELPKYANGLSLKTPINESPLSLEDRAKLSVGNDKGKMRYLKERFSDVQRAPNGDFIVKDKDGFYKRTDQEGYEGDPWSIAKEIAGDVADIVKPVAAIGAQIGAAIGVGAATGGIGLLGQAGTAAAVGAATEASATSLGRYFGTYDATPEEQLKDVALETVLNIGGTYVGAGIKPSLGLIGRGLEKAGSTMAKSMPAASRQAFTDAMGTMSGVGAKAYETLIDNSTAVGSVVKKAGLGAASSEEAIQRIAAEQVSITAKIARSARPALTSYYDDLSKEVLENVPQTFSSNLKQTTGDMLKAAQQAGVGVLDDATGKFKVFSVEDFAKAGEQTGVINPLAADKESLKLISEAVDAVQKYGGYKDLTGKAGASQLLGLKKSIGDLTYRLKEVADDAALAPAQRILTQMHQALENTVASKFELGKAVKSTITGKESTNLFSAMNETYSQAARELSPLMRATASATKLSSDAPFEALSKQLLAGSGRSAVQKSALDGLVDIVSKKGGPAGKVIADGYTQLQVNQAAQSFIPIFRKGLATQLVTAGSAGAAAAANPAVAAPLLGAAVATSPRVGMMATQGAMAAGQAVKKAVATPAAQVAVKSAMQGMQTFRSLSSKAQAELLRNPQAINAWLTPMVKSTDLYNQYTNQLVQGASQKILQSTGGGGGGQQQ